MKFSTLFAALLTLAVSPIPLFAERVTLKSGAVIEGRVETAGNEVRIHTAGSGCITLDRDDVAAIDTMDTPLTVRRAALAPEDITGRLRLAGDAAAGGQPGMARELYREVIALDPEQAEARQALGHANVRGIWYEGAALRDAQARRYLDGEWVSPEEFQRRLYEQVGPVENDAANGAGQAPKTTDDERLSGEPLPPDTMLPKAGATATPAAARPGDLPGFDSLRRVERLRYGRVDLGEYRRPDGMGSYGEPNALLRRYREDAESARLSTFGGSASRPILTHIETSFNTVGESHSESVGFSWSFSYDGNDFNADVEVEASESSSSSR